MIDQTTIELGQKEIMLDIAQDELAQANEKLEAYRKYISQRGQMIDPVEPEHSLIDVRYELCAGCDGLNADELKAMRMMYRTYFEVGADCVEYALDQPENEILSGTYIDGFHYYAQMMSSLSRLDKFTSILDRVIFDDDPVYLESSEFILFMHDMVVAAQDQILVWTDEDNFDDCFDYNLAQNCSRVLDWLELRR